ncbi:hypothetical protein [Alteromonas sp. 14N.309.X.WAT.G.H12]|uniref:hypothetical protein n=1 Tax=Alteromonas sp. 14N.309.X.WAT.G.H12 TaxID=3120824 RepID=UPI002FD5D659
MNNEQKALKKKLQSQLVLKAFVTTGDIDKEAIIDLLDLMSPSNESIHFIPRQAMVPDPLTKELIPSTSYKLQYPVSAEQARLLVYMRNADGFQTRSGSTLSIEKSKEGELLATVTGPDDFSEQIMSGRPIHANMINLEKYAKLDSVRELVRLIAATGIYQVNPEVKYLPTYDIGAFADYPNNIRHNLTQLVSDSTHIYVQYDKDVDSALRRDILDSENNSGGVGLGYIQMKEVHFPNALGSVIDTFNQIRNAFPNIKKAHPEPLTMPEKRFPQKDKEAIAPHGFKRAI